MDLTVFSSIVGVSFAIVALWVVAMRQDKEIEEKGSLTA